MLNALTIEQPTHPIFDFILFYFTLSGMFILSNATGELSKAKPLDREIKDFYSLLVSASDQGQSPLSSNTTINITILDANDQTPEIHTQTIFIIPEVQLYYFFIYHYSEKVLKNPSYFHSIHTVFCLPFQ